MARLATTKPDEAEAEPGTATERGVRLVDGELRYSDMWLDDEAVDDDGAPPDAVR
jgi:hypothetical protein